MDDRRLLTLAAKAAGYKVKWRDSDEGFFFGLGTYTPIYWNPLTDDGDAFRLAVQLGFMATGDDDCAAATNIHDPKSRVWMESLSDHHGDKMAACRRAIVRAAAAVGEKT